MLATTGSTRLVLRVLTAGSILARTLALAGTAPARSFPQNTAAAQKPIELLPTPPAPTPLPPTSSQDKPRGPTAGRPEQLNVSPHVAVPPLSLPEAERLAVQNSPQIRQAAANVEQARGLAVQSSLYPNPVENSGNPNQLGGANSLYSVGVTQEIVRGGKLRLSRAAADQAVRREQMNLIRTRYNVLTVVRQRFAIALAAQRRTEIYSQLLDFARRSERSSESLRQAGQIGETDVLLVRIERRRIEASLREAQAMLVGRKQQLAAALSMPGIAIDRLEGKLDMSLPVLEAAIASPAVVEGNAQLAAARAEVGRTRFALDRAVVEPIPNLTLQSGYQWIPSQPNSQALIGLYFPIPLFDRNQGNIRAARANVSGSISQYYVIRNDLSQQLAEAVSRYRAAEQRAAIYRTGVLPDAQRALRLVLEGYERGVFDIFRVLQSQRSISEAFLEYLAAEEERLIAAADVASILQLPEFP